MALRATAPIFVAQSVLDQARQAFAKQGSQQASGQQQPQEGQAEEEQAEEQQDDSSKDFRAIDKDKWTEILSQLDPDDFKYKM
jgi:bifunctional DNase/RNase